MDAAVYGAALRRSVDRCNEHLKATVLSRYVPALFALVLAPGCAPLPNGDITSVRFPAASMPLGVARSNQDLARDFLDLTFQLESGEELRGLLRYEEPVRVYMKTNGLEAYRQDLETLIERLQREAGLDIAITHDPTRAQIRVEGVPARRINRVFPTAACFIVPGETDWDSFIRHRSEDRLRWSKQDALRGAAVFVPSDTTPQDVRDCFNEELTQALGPANDLYRLPDSVWNDDNFHGIATSFDMLILRALYQPELASGMTRAEVAAELPSILNRTNPRGRDVARRPSYPESPEWARAIETALSRTAPRSRRSEAAGEAVSLSGAMQPRDHRLGVSLLTQGRLLLRQDPQRAAERFAQAYRLFQAKVGVSDIRTAQAGIHVAAVALGSREYDLVLRLADLHEPAARVGQNAILMAGFTSLRAEALDRLGQSEAATAARLESLRWARYGFGDSDGDLAREQARIATLTGMEDG